MVYTNSKGNSYNIPDTELTKLSTKLGISLDEAVELWLCDHGIEENEEQNEIEEIAKNNPFKVVAKTEKVTKKPRKPRTVKISDEKRRIFNDIKAFICEKYDATVEIDNKSLKIVENGVNFQLNLIENRKKK